jgi:hypothetical protein
MVMSRIAWLQTSTATLEMEFYCRGVDVPTVPLFEPVSPTLYQLQLTVDPSYTLIDPYGPSGFVVRSTTFGLCCQHALNFSAGGPGSYTLSYAPAVPEASSWAMCLSVWLHGWHVPPSCQGAAYIRLRRSWAGVSQVVSEMLRRASSRGPQLKCLHSIAEISQW